MGNFYTNITVLGPRPEDLLEYLQSNHRSAFVSPAIERFVVVYDKQCDTQDDRVLHSLTAKLSGEFECPAIFVLNHDDDILQYGLYQSGLRLDEYDSCPDYFGGPDDDVDYDSEEYWEDKELKDEPPPRGPIGGEAKKLCMVFNRVDKVNEVHKILHTNSYVFALERHAALAKALGLPSCSVGSGFTYLERGEAPSDFQLTDFKNTR